MELSSCSLQPYISLAVPAPLHKVRVWYASYASCTGLPKTNHNTPCLISEYLCLLHQRNDSNSITIVKVTSDIREKRFVLIWPFTLVDT